MHTRLQIDCPFTGPLATRTQQAVQSSAELTSQKPRLFLEICTAPPVTQEADSIDLFTNTTAARTFSDMHSARLTASSVTGIQTKSFAVNNPLSHICKGPIQ
ncbi:hypothetical protein FXF61_05420 [Pseudomonas sp. C27(2019)]|uniref:YdhR family protein n=1 Tax=Pseudomonas sp. C27(2019) TaxID=2604941 RepID=UPI001245E487|nr:YdhR family protein [Pseudomonas sp. C27(2019)]QEY58640.1 hypothetical protein FXF61_05420 [Pseudomonas sp. C27(2019)]